MPTRGHPVLLFRTYLVCNVFLHALHGVQGRILQGLHGQGPGLVQVPVEKKPKSSPKKVLQQKRERKEGEEPNNKFFTHGHFQVSLKSNTRQPGPKSPLRGAQA